MQYLVMQLPNHGIVRRTAVRSDGSEHDKDSLVPAAYGYETSAFKIWCLTSDIAASSWVVHVSLKNRYSWLNTGSGVLVAGVVRVMEVR
jgi:hypothetical protein